MRSVIDGIACTCERKGSLPHRCMKPHPSRCVFLGLFPEALTRRRGAVQWSGTPSSATPVAINPMGAALFWGDAQILSGEVVGTGTPGPLWGLCVTSEGWGLWLQVGRHRTLHLFHVEYWRAHHTAAFDPYPLWMRARSHDVERKAYVSQKQSVSSKPFKSL